MNRIIENNKVTMAGEIVSDFSFSHEVFGEHFYEVKLSVMRLSGVCDVIPLMISERLIDPSENLTGVHVKCNGEFRSYNRYEGGKHRLVLHVFVRNLEFDEGRNETDQIFLDGYVCKEPVYRKTPNGREITDILLAVNRPYGKSDYIPCICWGRNARFAVGFEVGTHIQIQGRIQSREYRKEFMDGSFEDRTAYEISIDKMEVFDDCED